MAIVLVPDMLLPSWNKQRYHLVSYIPVTILACIYATLAAPIPAPDLLRDCHPPVGLPFQEIPFNCCAPPSAKSPIEFDFNQSFRSVLRVRRPVYAVDEEYNKKLNRAYELMKALPEDDPRSFMQQANIHCAYGNAVYTQRNSSTPFQVHKSWLFFPFHRWYVYFHERILAKLLGDDDFALPFWNYDNTNGSTIPLNYISYSALNDRFREPSHLPPRVVMLDYYYMNATIRTDEEQLSANMHIMYRMMVTGATTPIRFFGQPYRRDTAPQPGSGTMETVPHNSIHAWMGDQAQIGPAKDMGPVYAAARDPVFYIHHTTLDRLWDVWKSFDGNRDIQDPDYINSEFVFYNENAELVRVKVGDSFSTEKLGYTYEVVENPWLNASTAPVSDEVNVLSANATLCTSGADILEACSAVVARNKTATGDETLVIEGIQVQVGNPARFDVFLNLPSASDDTMTNCTEYAGSFSSMAHVVTEISGETMPTAIYLSISWNVKELSLSDEESVVVTIVPRNNYPYKPVSVTSIKIEYEQVSDDEEDEVTLVSTA